MDITLDYKTIIAFLNIMVFVVVIPLLKYIWSGHLRSENKKWEEHDKDHKEFAKQISDSYKDEGKFRQDVMTRHENSITDLFDRTTKNCKAIDKVSNKLDNQLKICELKFKERE